jgi:peptidoglycan DL-endopeptidase CwlO
VADLAATEFETQGGFDPMAAMLGDAHGVRAYLNQIGLGQVFARNRTDILAKNSADSVVAGVFRAEARTALKQKQADVRQAATLKTAIQAAVSRQLATVKTTKSVTSQLSGLLQGAQKTEQSLAAKRQAALAAEAAAAAAAAARAAQQRAASAASASAPAVSYPNSPASSQQGNIAADWALSQIGVPYQWGGAGPCTYDCSGLTMVAWAHAGVALLHYTGDQWVEGVHVSLGSLQRGDLLFYATDNSDPATIHHPPCRHLHRRRRHGGRSLHRSRRAHRQHRRAGRPDRRRPPVTAGRLAGPGRPTDLARGPGRPARPTGQERRRRAPGRLGAGPARREAG